jgi:hypothetical protein
MREGIRLFHFSLIPLAYQLANPLSVFPRIGDNA